MALEDGVYPQQEEDRPPLGAHDDNYFCSGQLEFQFDDGSPNVFNDWTPDGHGSVDLHRALEASCDLYYWEIALRVWRGRGDEFDEAQIQRWAERLGFGTASGIDLPFEQPWDSSPTGNGSFVPRKRRRAGSGPRGAWSGGDVMNVVIGQGAVTATPLQVANAYAALVNGGTVWEPRVVSEILGEGWRPGFREPG